MSLPVIALSGHAYEQGLAHGRALGDEIAHNLAVYMQRFEEDALLMREEVFARGHRYLEALGRQSEAYVRGMRGIADGAGQSLESIAVLNLRYELLYHQYGRKYAGTDSVDGCTSFVLMPEATRSGHLIMGQNWDWIPRAKGALLDIHEDDGLRILAFTEAGILGAKIGLNSAGVGLGINGMTSSDDDWTRLERPFHLRCYEILRERGFADAVSQVTADERACTANFVIAQAPDRAVDLEASPCVVGELSPANGRLAHANHFEDPEKLGVTEPPNPNRHHSQHRARRLQELLEAGDAFTVEDIQACLRDHANRPNSVCRHEDESLPAAERVITVTSIIMDLHEGRLWATDGPPCQGEYQTLSLSD